MSDIKYKEFCKLRWYIAPYKYTYIKMVLMFTMLQAIFNFLLIIYVESVVCEGNVNFDYIDKFIFILIAAFAVGNFIVIFNSKKNQNYFIIFSSLYFGIFSIFLLYESCKLITFLFNDTYLYVIPLVLLLYFSAAVIFILSLRKHVISGKSKSMTINKASLTASSLAVLGVVAGKLLSKDINGDTGLLMFIFALQMLAYFFLALLVRYVYKYFLLKRYDVYINK